MLRVLPLLLTACVGTIDSGPAVPDAAVATPDAGHDAAPAPECEWAGAPGSCVDQAGCDALGDHTLETGCTAPAGCCIVTPSVSNDPPPPTGWTYMTQAEVTSDMTTWAVTILHDPITYPMFSTTIMQFPTLLVLARVEWHPPDFLNGVVHRGVTLFKPVN